MPVQIFYPFMIADFFHYLCFNSICIPTDKWIALKYWLCHSCAQTFPVTFYCPPSSVLIGLVLKTLLHLSLTMPSHLISNQFLKCGVHKKLCASIEAFIHTEICLEWPLPAIYSSWILIYPLRPFWNAFPPRKIQMEKGSIMGWSDHKFLTGQVIMPQTHNFFSKRFIFALGMRCPLFLCI